MTKSLNTNLHKAHRAKKDEERDAIYISRDREVCIGEKALKKIEKRNDKQYFNSEEGVKKVDMERWQEAQSFEQNTWMRDFRRAKDDSNERYQKQFDDYTHLEEKRFQRAIELGCGPFTNMRIIAQKTKVDEIHLLDPLIGEYLKHPYCYYKKKRLRLRTWPGLFSRKVPVILHAVPIEKFETEKKFDLVVMMNVIEHCYDLGVIWEKILKMSTNDAHLIFYDKWFPIDMIKKRNKTWFDAGHPLRVRGEEIDNFLDENYIPDLKKLVYHKCFKRGMDVSYYGFYFSGRRKRAEESDR